MKRLLILISFIPMLSSCVAENDYYGDRYYRQPRVRVEAPYGYDSVQPRTHYHDEENAIAYENTSYHGHQRPSPQRRYHGHRRDRTNQHGHGYEERTHGHNALPNARVHGHDEAKNPHVERKEKEPQVTVHSHV